MSTLNYQAVIPVADPEPFGALRSAIQAAFDSPNVAGFLKSIERAGIRIREFERVLHSGKLGAATEGEYGLLGNADRGMIREFYLASLEQVAPELRQKFFKLYAYY